MPNDLDIGLPYRHSLLTLFADRAFSPATFLRFSRPGIPRFATTNQSCGETFKLSAGPSALNEDHACATGQGTGDKAIIKAEEMDRPRWRQENCKVFRRFSAFGVAMAWLPMYLAK